MYNGSFSSNESALDFTSSDRLFSDRFVSSSAILSMLLEVSGYPKPGNVSRAHDFSDTAFEHFLYSAAFMPFVFQDAFFSRKTLGSLLYDSVYLNSFRFGGNTHFGTFLLLIPLCMAAGTIEKGENFSEEEINPEKIKSEIVVRAYNICKNTTSDDAVCFYKSFQKSNTFACKIEAEKSFSDSKDLVFSKFDLTSDDSIYEIESENVSLYDLMKSAEKRDLIAHEWCFGFSKSLSFSKDLDYFYDFFSKKENESFCYGSPINSATVSSFLIMLSKTPDSLIASKHGPEKAFEIKNTFKNLLEENNFYENIDLNSLISEVKRIDYEMVFEKLNPGSLADITSAGIFLSILGGLKF